MHRMSDAARDYPPIADYAAVGDCRATALISKAGSVDWLCLPRFDSPSVFAAMLDARAGGRFAVRPADPFTSVRRYIGSTNVLETTFTTPSGRARLVDLMTVASAREGRHELQPEHELLRRVECIEGRVEIEVVCDPRPGYARARSTARRQGALGVLFDAGEQAYVLGSEIDVGLVDDGAAARGRAVLHSGEVRRSSLASATGGPVVVPPLGTAADARIDRSIAWWMRWAGRCTYTGPHREAVLRSALALKLMSYAPSGAVIAAPTTSLPEHVGGERNWDYRYTWLRDASFTLRSLFDLGYTAEGEAFLSWLIHATRLTHPELQVLYDVHGDTRLSERELDHLEGYRGSRPVRIGNDARAQLQLDVYGEVVDAAFQYALRGGRWDRTTGEMLAGLGATVCRRWREPDEGIWEVRSGRAHHTFSKALCWIALDRLIRLHRAGRLRIDRRRLRRERERIGRAIEAEGWNGRLGSYVSTFGGTRVDASLLLLPVYGYVEPAAGRMRSTVRRIYERLGAGDGLLYRYRGDDGLAGGEGAFGIASFWGVECRARQGALEEATRDFDRLCALANDVGLFAEEIEPSTGAALGNFPQAFTHVGLISAALTLAECRGEAPPPGMPLQAERSSDDGGGPRGRPHHTGAPRRRTDHATGSPGPSDGAGGRPVERPGSEP
ncbi:MAG: glycoside hydrolase family 15 protein [Gemmatimonadota bacterium]